MFEVSIALATAPTANFSGAGARYNVTTPNGVHYVVYIDNALDVVYRKSADGVLWSSPVTIFAGSATAVSVWYDRWSNISAGLIHCVYTETAGDETRYRSINTESNDALSSETSMFNGGSTANGGALSVTRARGGNIYCKTMIDAGAEGGFFRSTDVGATWGARTDSEALATQDQWILLPGWAADSQDIMMFFWDASADEISRCLYDDSADSWAETSIATTMVDTVATTFYPNFSAAVDITNSQNLLVAWTAADLANADLRCWKITESAITEVTNVVLDSTDDQGLCVIGIDTTTQDWYVFYSGKSDGTETFNTNVQGYYKKSTDDGATWGAETEFLPTGGIYTISALWCSPRFDTRGVVCVHYSSALIISVANAPVVVQPTYALGI